MRGRLLIFVLLILVVIGIAAVVLLQGQNTPAPVDPNTGEVQQRVDVTLPPTATPIPMVNVVIALQNLPRGYRFPDKLEDLVNVVTYSLA